VCSLDNPDNHAFGVLSPLSAHSLHDIIPYAEAQYHGGVSTQHIAHVYIPKKSSTKKMTTALSQAGIPYTLI
jgi:hypothetical protein